MKTTVMLKTAFLSAAALLLCATSALAQNKLTVGVGHMCCGGCKTAASAALAKVASDVSIDGKNITMTLKGDDLVPALEALRTGGFPATSINAGGAPVRIGVGHLCCGACVNSLRKAMTEAKVEGLDPASIQIVQADKSMTVKAEAGKSLDLAPVLAAMEKGGFSATKITLGTAAASNHKSVQHIARAK